MDAAGRVRRAALETLTEIEPPNLATELQRIVQDTSMVPGALTLRTAERLGGLPAAEGALDRAVGVQLSYEGLRLTRELIQEDHRYDVAEPTDEYLALIAAEVMVSRGFSELAQTPVADRAIEIVQRFSRNQTVDYDRDPELQPTGHSLEYDVLRLAVATGATVVYSHVPAYLEEFGRVLASELDRYPLPPADTVDRRIRSGLEGALPADDGIVVND